MGTKSIREAVEAAVVAHLNAQGFGSTATVHAGLSIDKVDPPMVVASCEQVGPHPDVPEGYGNFSAQMTVMIVSPANVDGALAAHRALGEKVLSAMYDESGLQAIFAAQGDAAMYFCTFATSQDSRGEETFGTTLDYTILGVINP